MKRGQSAIEFLATYGFVLLVGFFSITSLGLYGVLNPAKFLPDACVVESGMACNDVSFNTLKLDGYATYDGIGLLGIELTNGLPKGITHAYVVIDPEDASCGGYFGILASPKIMDTWMSGEKRKVRYYNLKYSCAFSEDCDDELQYTTCYTKLYLCAESVLDQGLPAACDSNFLCPLPYQYDPDGSGPLPVQNLDGYTCVNKDIKGYSYGQCYGFPPLSSVPYLICDCAGENCAEKEKTYNCCDSEFARGTGAFPDSVKDGLSGNPGFCEGYQAADTCPQGVKMVDDKLYGVDFYVYYKTIGSAIFHKTTGHLRVTNQGPTSDLS